MPFNLRKIRLGGAFFNRPLNAGDVPSICSSSRPGLLVILIDQSGSMKDEWGDSGSKRMDMAADYVNRTIHTVIVDSLAGTITRQRMWIAALGYSVLRGDNNANAVRLLDQGWPQHYEEAPGDWIKPFAKGGTLMSLAFQGARQYLEQFFADPDRRELYARSMPVVVLNITDGKATEYDSSEWSNIRREVDRLWRMPMPNGYAPLVFNVHISDDQNGAFLPTTEADLDNLGKELFQVSSEIPDSWILHSGEDFQAKRGSVGLIMNASPEQLIKMLEFSSRHNSNRRSSDDLR